ncbi:hypothetical protein LCGC14_1506150 [marine sediment metagenome]|uniref:ERF family protein n=1 Tax=marine sediment metagenome TaxID=412755 RepID=A0A0F9LI11_9ZZZZ
MEEKNEIQKTEEAPLMRIITLASADGNIDADKLMKLLEVNERYEANEAKKAYVIAMAEFKKNPPEIIKDRNVNYSTSKGTTNYNHATLANVTSTINTALSGHGLTASWITAQENGVKVTCKITHILGHSEETTLTAAPDTSGGKNAIQAIGSTVTYLQRYTLLALTGLATTEQDDDGAASEDKTKPKVHKPDEKEQMVIEAICDALPQQEGKRVDPIVVGAILYGSKSRYPNSPDHVEKVVKWFADNPRPQIYVDDKRSDFEKDNDLDGDDDSVPDEALRQAEETAKEKFGTEQKESRYTCNRCNHEYDTPNKHGNCPKCFSDDAVDRQGQDA